MNEAGDGSLISAGISKTKWRARLRAVVECRVVGLRVDTREQNGLGQSRGEREELARRRVYWCLKVHEGSQRFIPRANGK